MELGLRGRVALVTAASRGLGRACALALAREGARVAVSARDRANLERLVGELEAAGGGGLAVPMDLRDEAAVEGALERVRAGLGEVDILIGNAPGPPSGPFQTISMEEWRDALDLHVLAMVRLLRAVLPGMRRRRWGRVVFVTTVGVRSVQPEMVLSNATRLALTGAAKTAAVEAAADGVCVNVLAPGPIATERMEELVTATAERHGVDRREAERRWLEDVPMGRMGRPEDVAAMAALLCSDAGGYVTGSVIPVDGGKSRAY
jgi:3-oxoacyl-[acyl-carrier protein] reductase